MSPAEGAAPFRGAGLIERFVARRLFGLPGRLQVRLSGRPPCCLDGLTLDPEMQLLLAALAWRHVAPLRAETPELARARFRASVLHYVGRPFPVGAVRELAVGGAAGPLRARHYLPRRPRSAAGERPPPLLLFFHGGGFVTGDLDTHDAACRLICRHGDMQVLSVEYRLAPEHPFPAGVEDARAALRWAHARAAELGADPARVGVGGDSAGASLAAVVSQLAARDGGPPPAMQLLIYPSTDIGNADWPSRTLFADGFMLTREDIRWFDAHYVPEAVRGRGDARAAPLRAPDLGGLCPALIATAGFDPLRDEGEAYAAALRAAGTPATLRRFPGLLHGFVNMVSVSGVARAAVVELARSLRALAGPAT